MKRFLVLILSVVLFYSCNQSKEQEPRQLTPKVEEGKKFPLILNKIFEAHGGLENWEKMNSFSFKVQKSDGAEVHMTDLKSRKTRIEAETFTLGFDGRNVWKLDPDQTFKGNSNFYYSLIFYFHAMPFIISDPGAFYTERKDVVFERKNLGAIHIGFGRSVGDSPDDEYIIYYDKETNRMEWLGYTVTYFEGEKSTEWHLIKYDQWLEENGLLLPEKLIWYDVKNEKPVKPSQTMSFSEVEVSETPPDDSLFTAPPNAVYE